MGLCPAYVPSAHPRGQWTVHGHAERVPPCCLGILWMQDCVWSAWGAGQKFQGVTDHRHTTTNKEKELVHKYLSFPASWWDTSDVGSAELLRGSPAGLTPLMHSTGTHCKSDHCHILYRLSSFLGLPHDAFWGTLSK